MILENAVPILALAIDDVPAFYNQHLGALSQKRGEVSIILKGYIRHCWHDVMGQHANNDG
ncbi:hypothetical protein D3C84_838450 [compost metagenome]